jgi:DNA-binding transcriptional ArsR family regulator
MPQERNRMDKDLDPNTGSHEYNLNLEAIKKFSDPEIVGIIFHEQRGLILKSLINNDKTIRELSQELNLNPGTVKRHITDLLNNQLIDISDIKKNDYGITMIYYRATAQNFQIELDFNRDFNLYIKKI